MIKMIEQVKKRFKIYNSYLRTFSADPETNQKIDRLKDEQLINISGFICRAFRLEYDKIYGDEDND